MLKKNIIDYFAIFIMSVVIGSGCTVGIWCIGFLIDLLTK